MFNVLLTSRKTLDLKDQITHKKIHEYSKSPVYLAGVDFDNMVDK